MHAFFLIFPPFKKRNASFSSLLLAHKDSLQCALIPSLPKVTQNFHIYNEGMKSSQEREISPGRKRNKKVFYLVLSMFH